MKQFVVIECTGKSDPICKALCPFWFKRMSDGEICFLGKIDDHIYPDFDLDWALGDATF